MFQKQALSQTTYRAICGLQQAIGATPGQALDMRESELATQGLAENGETVITIQRFRPDNFFNANQQSKLRKLMDQFLHANAVGDKLTPAQNEELQQLVDAELQATIKRAEAIVKRS
ncbi:hypothetical protein [Iningainema tapete]|uniref:Uncharacterized protein n=1 Tax=Iningainema tapete BLCC-T55 TaxID=2748662 RepID=A0A8J6XRC4_9CYAN|nr:hypothetical protein [Iningainema tapete]MBD2778152.1 hypothetical protein [Iningainema tapete BLCC-T55]